MDSLDARALELCQSISNPRFIDSVKDASIQRSDMDAVHDRFLDIYQEAESAGDDRVKNELEAGLRKLDALRRVYGTQAGPSSI